MPVRVDVRWAWPRRPGMGSPVQVASRSCRRRLHDRLLHLLRNALYRLIPAQRVDGEVIRGRRTEYGVKAWRIMWLDPPKTDTRIRSGRVVQNMAVYRLTFYGQTRLKSRPPHARSPHSHTGPRGVRSNWKQVVYIQPSRNSGLVVSNPLCLQSRAIRVETAEAAQHRQCNRPYRCGP
ncbi:hypothetical protein BDV11DRAFT_99411 [Aspergillus similis]